MSEEKLNDDILQGTVGLRLCKVSSKGVLRIGETVIFKGGRPAVITTLNRAALSGHVGGGIDDDTTYWADQIGENEDSIGEIRLDQGSWSSLKNRWMRCRLEPA